MHLCQQMQDRPETTQQQISQHLNKLSQGWYMYHKQKLKKKRGREEAETVCSFKRSRPAPRLHNQSELV